MSRPDRPHSHEGHSLPNFDMASSFVSFFVAFRAEIMRINVPLEFSQWASKTYLENI